MNSGVGKKAATEFCSGTPLCLDPLPYQETEVSHLLESPPGQQQQIQRQSLLREVREADVIFLSLLPHGFVSSIRGRA